MAHRHRRLRASLAALILAIWSLGSAADLIGHALLAHVLCPEHGVVEHRAGPTAVASEPGTGGEHRTSIAAADPDDHGDGCACALAQRVTVRTRAVALPEIPSRSVPAPAPPAVRAPPARPPLAYAPKNSPPA